jgi:hypothetical protein
MILLRMGVSLALSVGLMACTNTATRSTPNAIGQGMRSALGSFSPQASSMAHQVGAWSGVLSWPGVAIHAALLPTGKVLTFSTASGDDRSVTSSPNSNAFPHNSTQFTVWDPMTNRFQNASGSNVEMFCAGQTFDANGNLIVVGGHNGVNKGGLLGLVEFYEGINAANRFDAKSEAFERLPNMAGKRWYPSAITLGNGDVLVVGGSHNSAIDPAALNPEVWDGQGWRSLIGAGSNGSVMPVAPDWITGSAFTGEVEYPKLHLLSDGQVFWNGGSPKYAWLNPNGQGSWSKVQARTGADDLEHFHGASVMYQPGQVLTAAGGEGNGAANNKAYRVSVTGSSARFSTLPDTHFARSYLNATLLADGGVAITDGTAGGGGDKKFNTAKGIHAVELWNPKRPNLWTLGPEAAVTRGYHGTALLLPDARVLTAGGGACGSCGGQNNNAELYYPPYLFKKDGSGQLARRPVIAEAPTVVRYGEPFTVKLENPLSVSRVTLLRLGAVTHTFNMNQRFLEPGWVYAPARPEVTLEPIVITAPSNPNDAPAGHYLLFVFDGLGVPSVARVLQLR